MSLKLEARSLLDEINNNFERSPNGARILNWPYDAELISGELSFRDRLKKLKVRIHAFSAQNIRV